MVIAQVISHSISGHQWLSSVHAKLNNTILDAYTPSCVCYRPRGDKKKVVNFFLVTTAAPVCTCCIIAEIQMHGHTPGISTVLLISKMMRFVAHQKSSQVSTYMAHIVLHNMLSLTLATCGGAQ